MKYYQKMKEEWHIARIVRAIALCLTALLILQPAQMVIPTRAVDRVVLDFGLKENDGGDSSAASKPAPVISQEPVPETPKPQEPQETQSQETQLQEPQPQSMEPQEEEVEPVQYVSNFPLYFQNDYPDVRYGSGTIKTSGCGITALAMVATYMTGHEYYPDDLANYFASYTAVSNLDRMLHAADQLQLPWRQAKDWREVPDALRNGNPVIVLEDNNSDFTTGQHFIVLTGITEEGRILVYDPNRVNYTDWRLKQGFEKGFTEAEICSGYCGSWIFEMDQMPEDPFIYEPEEKLHVTPRYHDVELTAEEEDLLARVVWVESRGEPARGQQAVAEVVLNRLMSDRFPNSIKNIIYSEGQFRSVPYLEDATPTATQYDAIEKALNGPFVLPMEVYYFATEAMTDDVWGQIGGHIFCY